MRRALSPRRLIEWSLSLRGTFYPIF